MSTNNELKNETVNGTKPVLVAGWVSLPDLPIEKEDNVIYSERVIFKTKRGVEYKGWVRFDFENFVVSGKQIVFEYSEVDCWQYDTACH